MNQGTASTDAVEWDACKVFIRGRIIAFAYASHKKRLREMKERTLKDGLTYLLSQFAGSPTQDLYWELQKVKYELNNILAEKAEYALTGLHQW